MSGIWHSGDVEGQGEDEAVRADLRREGAGMKWGMRDTVGRLRKFCGSVKKVVRKLVVRTSEEGSRAVPEARHVPTVEVHVVGNNAGVQKVASREETARLVEGVARRRDSSRRRSELVQTLGEQEAYVLEGMITPDQVEDGERASYFGEVMGSR